MPGSKENRPTRKAWNQKDQNLNAMLNGRKVISFSICLTCHFFLCKVVPMFRLGGSRCDKEVEDERCTGAQKSINFSLHDVIALFYVIGCYRLKVKECLNGDNQIIPIYKYVVFQNVVVLQFVLYSLFGLFSLVLLLFVSALVFYQVL